MKIAVSDDENFPESLDPYAEYRLRYRYRMTQIASVLRKSGFFSNRKQK